MQNILTNLVLILTIIKSGYAINCYVCNATDSLTPFQCGEWFDRYDSPEIQPQNCSSVHGARYCIKHIGRFEVHSIKCYQCSSANTINCSDLIVDMQDSPIQAEECDSVYDAKYCIKSTAQDGGIGAKRFCSSKDLGNYCNYVQNKGDKMEYRSCIFTCSTDGCNSSTVFLISKLLLVTSTLVLVYLFK